MSSRQCMTRKKLVSFGISAGTNKEKLDLTKELLPKSKMKNSFRRMKGKMESLRMSLEKIQGQNDGDQNSDYSKEVMPQMEAKVSIHTVDAPHENFVTSNMKDNRKKPKKTQRDIDIADKAMARCFFEKSTIVLNQAVNCVDPIEFQKLTARAFTYASATEKLVTRSNLMEGESRQSNYLELIEDTEIPAAFKSSEEDVVVVAVDDDDDQEDFLPQICTQMACGQVRVNDTARLMALKTSEMLNSLAEEVSFPLDIVQREMEIPQKQILCNSQKCIQNDNRFALSCADWRARVHSLSLRYRNRQRQSDTPKNSLLDQQTGLLHNAVTFFRDKLREKTAGTAVERKPPPIDLVRVDTYSTCSEMTSMSVNTEALGSIVTISVLDA